MPKNLPQQARYRAIQRLIEAHAAEFARLHAEEKGKLGVRDLDAERRAKLKASTPR